MVDDMIKRGQRLLAAVERREAKIAKLAKQNIADLAELHELARDAVARHGRGAGASDDVVAAVVAPKEPKPD